MRKRLIASTLAVVIVVAGVTTLVSQDSKASITEVSKPVTTAPGVTLDTSIFLPQKTPAPAVLLGHGFGGSKNSVRADALYFARHGYVAMTWSARGFGASSGSAGIDAPNGEAADVSRLIDALASRPEVLLDRPGDPRVGVTGQSYGGGVALLASALDRRIDAIAPQITWSDLTQAFSPQSATGTDSATPGVVKSGWASLFFGLGTQRPTIRPTTCSFTPDICTAYENLQENGKLSPADAQVLAVRSTINQLPTAPTLIMQGERDTLFPLAQGTSLAKKLQAAGTHVKLVWLRGGHDGGSAAEDDRVHTLTRTWFDRWLNKDTSVDTGSLFEARVPGGRTIHRDYLPGADPQSRTASFNLNVLPGGFAGALTTKNLQANNNQAITIVNPPGGLPASISSLPGLGSVTALTSGLSVDFPGQAAVFEGPVLQEPLETLGAGHLRVRLTSSSGSAVLFAKVYDVSAGGEATLPDAQIAPLRVEDLPTRGQGRLVTITLPEISTRFAAGHHLRVALVSTDQSYLGSRSPATYTVAGGEGTGLDLALSPDPTTGGLAPLALAGLTGLGIVLIVGVVVALQRRRRRSSAVVLGQAMASISERTAPLELVGLTKRWPNGLTAVDDVTITVAHGEILGLLGPNGAGKTTALRMALGLIHPTAGEVRIFGTKVTPGSPALERVGAFVEGPGFLPHLSGIDNLQLWWRATGAHWTDANADEAIAIAGLGDAIRRPVKSYSQGMRQRLAIAQAMLGSPDLVILDEPTNGLDPPQIVEMRRVIKDIAERGATVVVSSHLLAEVEQTCTSVAVMSLGRLLVQGSVSDVVGADRAVRVELSDRQALAIEVLCNVPGVGEVTPAEDEDAVNVELGTVSREEVLRVLVQAGVPVTGMAARRALEETFLELVNPQ